MLSFINDKRGISEEFTSLPALTVVMIGFAIFLVLITGVYHSYNEEVKTIDKYEAANFVLEKITSSNGILEKKEVLKPGGIIDETKFVESMENYEEIIKESGVVGVEFGLKLEYEGNNGEIEWKNIPSSKDVVAASKRVSVSLNEAQTVPGVLTVMVWEV